MESALESGADLIAKAKARLGDPRMSDQRLGDHAGFAQQTIAKGKNGGMSDHVATELARIAGVDPGHAIWIARVERERDPEVRGHLVRWMNTVKKVLASVPTKVASVAVAMALGLFLQLLPQPVNAGVGGVGRLRRGYAPA